MTGERTGGNRTGQDPRRAELTEELLRLFRKRYAALGEISEMTEELGEALDRSDQVSARMILKMRAGAMAKTDRLVRDTELIFGAAGEDAARLRALSRGEEVPGMDSREESLMRIGVGCRSILKKTVRTDQRLSRRLAGEESFYSGEQS